MLKEVESVVYADEWRIDTVRPFDFLGCVTTPKRRKTILHPFQLRESLPALPIPLLESVPDVVLSLQAAIDRAWDEGPYPVLLNYTGEPSQRWPEADRSWMRKYVNQSLI